VVESSDAVGLLEVAMSDVVGWPDDVNWPSVSLVDNVGFSDVVGLLAVAPSAEDDRSFDVDVSDGMALLSVVAVDTIGDNVWVSEPDKVKEVLVDGRHRPALTPNRFAATQATAIALSDTIINE
jgi:hypothetical protein